MDMEWDDVDPIVKTVPWAKAWLKVNNDTKVRLHISFSEAMMNECGRPTKANVQVGVKGEQALVRMVWDKNGKFTVREMEKGGGRISSIPPKAPMPDGSRDAEACEVIKKDKTEAILAMPLADWEKQLSQPVKPVPPPPVKPVAPVKPAGQPTQKEPLEAVAYLRSKGVRIQKLAGDWWSLEGNRVPRMEVLARVNEIRRKNELKPLGLDEIA